MSSGSVLTINLRVHLAHSRWLPVVLHGRVKQAYLWFHTSGLNETGRVSALLAAREVRCRRLPIWAVLARPDSTQTINTWSVVLACGAFFARVHPCLAVAPDRARYTRFALGGRFASAAVETV
jgi:hypothetical protein